MLGFQQIDQQLWISKDPEAQLFYTFDWSQWLQANDTIESVEYTITARVNDPTPLLKVSSGVDAGLRTFVELSNGQLGKSYVVTAKIVTTDGLIDRRSFKLKVENRSG